MRKAVWYVVAILLCLAVVAGIAVQSFVNSLEPRARQRVVAALQDRFDADVQLKRLDLSLFPEPNVVAEGLVISHKRWSDPQPLISIKRFTARTDFLTALNRKNHVDFVRLEGLEIHVPPRGSSASKESIEAKHEVESGEPGNDKTQLQFLIQTIVADGTVLEIEPKEPGKDPLRFEIKELTLHSVGPGQPMAFDARLTNAKPPGLIDSTGRFGPWQKDDPRSTPVSGDYKFEHADLGVFKGIRGILSSVGKYHGVLQHIEVDGTTDTPDFALKRAGSPVHLKTRFHSVVNGTDGDTILDPVDAQFLQSEFICTGGVVHKGREPGKTVSLDAYTTHARMEDILELVMDSGPPVLTGAVNFRSKIEIPPGDEEVIDKLRLDGNFSIRSARFTSTKVQQRILTLSDRARGISKDEQAEANQSPQTVASNFQGRFRLNRGVTSFSTLSFSVPGAQIRLAGSYNMRSGQIDMDGVFRMQATLSDTQSGLKHYLLIPLDPFFRKNGAGFEVPITINGTREHPSIAAEVFHKKFTIH